MRYDAFMRTMILPGLLLALSCGGPSDTRSTVPDALLDGPAQPSVASSAEGAESTTPAAPTPEPPALSAEQGCARLSALSAQGCSWTQRFPAEFARQDVCERSVGSWLAPGSASAADMTRMVSCWGLDCEDAAACMVRARTEQPAPTEARACGDEGVVAVEVDAAIWKARRGVGARRFSEMTTSVDEPVEVCGIEGEIEWMTQVTCDDGSKPYTSATAVNDGRDAWFDRGGRCNSVLDRYSVVCPEATYTIHIDRYICPAGAARTP